MNALPSSKTHINLLGSQGAEIAGKIVTDMTFLKDSLLVIVDPQPSSRVRPHYRIEYELVLLVDGNDMKFEARYPPGGGVLQSKQICIASVFNAWH